MRRGKSMLDDWNENFMSYLQRLLPLISSLLLLFISYTPLDFFPVYNIRPAIGFVCVYYWLIHRPDLFNLLSVYFLGLVDDIISNVPFGANIFSMLVLYVLLNSLIRFFNSKPFVITWYGFMIMSFAAFITKWLVLSIYYAQFLPFSIVFFSFMFTVAVYPFLSLILAFVQNNMIADEE